MNEAPFRLKPADPARRRRFVRFQRALHERLFGEELSRVNLDFDEEQRLDYLRWMRDTVRQRGRELPPNYSVAWMLKIEEDVACELNEKP